MLLHLIYKGNFMIGEYVCMGENIAYTGFGTVCGFRKPSTEGLAMYLPKIRGAYCIL